MGFDFAAAKAAARQEVHDTLAVSAFYSDDSLPDPVPVKVRWHTKQAIMGDIENMGYAQVIENLHSIVFDKSVARDIPVVRGGTITITAFDNATFTLDTRLPYNGPITESWQVTQE